MQFILIDDNPHVRDRLKQMVEQLSLNIGHILEASCDASALQLIRKHRPDVIITDAKLLLLSEANLLDQMYEQQKNSRIIVTSSHEFVLKAFCQGGIDSLLKPIGQQNLEDVLYGFAGTSIGPEQVQCAINASTLYPDPLLVNTAL